MGANFSTNINNLINVRYGKNNKTETGPEAIKPSTAQATPQSMTDQLTPKKLSKNGTMFYAYAPLLLVNLLVFVILLIGLSFTNVTLPDTASITQVSDVDSLLAPIFSLSIWGIIDILQIITLSIWIPITMSIALRDLANSSTTKLLISCVIIGVLVSFFAYMLRPTLTSIF